MFEARWTKIVLLIVGVQVMALLMLQSHGIMGVGGPAKVGSVWKTRATRGLDYSQDGRFCGPPKPRKRPEGKPGNFADLEMAPAYRQFARLVELEPQRRQSPSPILCIVGTVDLPGANLMDKTDAQLATWIPRTCDGLLVYSNYTDMSRNMVAIMHDGVESHDNMWRKMRSMLFFLHAHLKDCLEPYDWFYLVDDDTYIIGENLRSFILEKETETGVYRAGMDRPVYLGRKMAEPGLPLFNQGGAGALLNARGLAAIYHAFTTDACPVNENNHHDRTLGICAISQGVYPEDTRDREQRHRFHIYPPDVHYAKAPSVNPPEGWIEEFSAWQGGNFKYGDDYFSRTSIAFHYMWDDAIYYMDELIYGPP